MFGVKYKYMPLLWSRLIQLDLSPIKAIPRHFECYFSLSVTQDNATEKNSYVLVAPVICSENLHGYTFSLFSSQIFHTLQLLLNVIKHILVHHARVLLRGFCRYTWQCCISVVYLLSAIILRLWLAEILILL